MILMGVAASAAGGVMSALATVDDDVVAAVEVMALAAKGAKDAEARRDCTSRRRVMLSALLKFMVVNSGTSFPPLFGAAGTAVIALFHLSSALLMRHFFCRQLPVLDGDDGRNAKVDGKMLRDNSAATK